MLTLDLLERTQQAACFRLLDVHGKHKVSVIKTKPSGQTSPHRGRREGESGSHVDIQTGHLPNQRGNS